MEATLRKLYTVLGQDDALTMVSLPDGRIIGVLFTSPDRAMDFARLYDIPATEVVEIATPTEYIMMASAFLEAQVKEAILDPSPDGILLPDQLLDFNWLAKMGDTIMR